MKKNHKIALAIGIAGLALCAAIYIHPRQLPLSQCSEVYLQYRGNPDVEASYVKNFPLNDSVSVDVTMLKVQDSASWADLIMTLFHIESRDEYVHRDITFKLIPSHRGEAIQEGLAGNDLIAGSLSELAVGVFHLESEEQYNALMDIYFHLLTNKNKHHEKNI